MGSAVAVQESAQRAGRESREGRNHCQYLAEARSRACLREYTAPQETVHWAKGTNPEYRTIKIVVSLQYAIFWPRIS